MTTPCPCQSQDDITRSRDACDHWGCKASCKGHCARCGSTGEIELPCELGARRLWGGAGCVVVDAGERAGTLRVKFDNGSTADVDVDDLEEPPAETDVRDDLIDTLDTAIALRKQLSALDAVGVYATWSPLVVIMAGRVADAERVLRLWASAHRLGLRENVSSHGDYRIRAIYALDDAGHWIAGVQYDPEPLVRAVPPPHATDDQNRTDVDSQQLWVPQ